MEVASQNIILYENVKVIEKIDFEDYLKIEAKSFSSMKSTKNGLVNKFKVSDKIVFGKIVDEILTGDESLYFGHDFFSDAFSVAQEIINFLGPSYKKIKTQSSYVGVMIYSGIKMIIKGRTDCEHGKNILIDIKVTNDAKNIQDCHELIKFMGYDKQLFNYACLSGRKQVYILMYSRKVKRCFLIKLFKTDQEIIEAVNWWSDKILEHGNVKTDINVF